MDFGARLPSGARPNQNHSHKGSARLRVRKAILYTIDVIDRFHRCYKQGHGINNSLLLIGGVNKVVERRDASLYMPLSMDPMPMGLAFPFPTSSINVQIGWHLSITHQDLQLLFWSSCHLIKFEPFKFEILKNDKFEPKFETQNDFNIKTDEYQSCSTHEYM